MLESALALAANRAAEIEAIYEAAPIGIVLFDTDFRYLRINRRLAEINRRSVDDHIGRLIEDILPADTCTFLRSLRPRLMAGEDVLGLEISGINPAVGVLESWQVSYRPLANPGGTVHCFLGTIENITPLKAAEAQLRRSNATYLSLIENNPFGIYLVDADFRLASISRGAAAAFALGADAVGADFAGLIRTIWAQPFADHVIDRFRHTLATGEPWSEASSSARGNLPVTQSFDWRIERVTLPDGSHGVVCYFYDLTERQHYEERIGLLMREVDHRARNLLTVVSAVARHTVATTPQDFLPRFEQRLQALSESQDLLVRSGWTQVDLATLARAQLAHLDDLLGPRISLSSPEVRLNPASAQALGMALHELATNAAKHGALAGDHGHVRLAWSVADDRLRICWQEIDGPPVVPPSRKGFGSTVIGAMVRASLGGSVALDYAPDGLRWSIDCPLQRATGAV